VLIFIDELKVIGELDVRVLNVRQVVSWFIKPLAEIVDGESTDAQTLTSKDLKTMLFKLQQASVIYIYHMRMQILYMCTV
jgi:hypothetical protein